MKAEDWQTPGDNWMNLRDGVVGVRNRLGESKPWLFDTNDIVRDLNRSARSLCSAAQALRATWEGTTALNQAAGSGVYFQEYQLPADVEVPYGGSIKNGIKLPLQFRPQEELQNCGYAARNPFFAYLRRGILLTQQTSDGGMDVQAPINKDGVATWIVGFYPVPSSAIPFWIDYVAYHPWMQNPLDPCLIPDTGDLARAWEAYAVARGKEKEGDLVSAEHYDRIHAAGKEFFTNYMLSVQSAVTPPIYGQGNITQQPFIAVMQPMASNLRIQP